MRNRINWVPSWLRDKRREIASTNNGSYAPQYYAMVTQMDQDIGLQYTVLAGCFAWLLLAGFLLSPATYVSARYVDTLEKTGLAGTFSIGATRNSPVIGLACAACVIATSGLGWLWWKWRHNFIWINRYIVIPALINSATGFSSTLLNVYCVQDGQWSITAIVTAAIVGSMLIFTLLVFGLYEFVMLPRVKRGDKD